MLQVGVHRALQIGQKQMQNAVGQTGGDDAIARAVEAQQNALASGAVYVFPARLHNQPRLQQIARDVAHRSGGQPRPPGQRRARSLGRAANLAEHPRAVDPLNNFAVDCLLIAHVGLPANFFIG